MSAILAWLLAQAGTIGAALVGAALTWIYNLLMAKYRSNQDIKATHQADVDQANQDDQKLEQVKPDSSAEDVDAAADDALKHI